MIFNSVEFAVFFLLFFFAYWFLFAKNLRFQNLLLLAGNYVFYAWWNWKFLALIIAFSWFNYKLGHYIHRAGAMRVKSNLARLATLAGIGLLAYFKYANFFLASLSSALAGLDISLTPGVLNIILPIGISFYTFRTLSYIYDIKNGKYTPTNDWVTFFSFVSFFPCLLAGPIDRAKNLIPQLERPRQFDYPKAAVAIRQILWGAFKKLVIADNLVKVTAYIFDHYNIFPGSTLLLGSFYYAIQLYADFSGYSDMAIGFARLLGFEVAKNFNYPFFAQNVAEYWRRWHISLTLWLTEYVFTPLSIRFRDLGKIGLAIAIIINFLLVGIWHGANWTFAVFGLVHGCYFIPLIITGKLNKKKNIDPDKLLPSLIEFKNICITFIMVSLALVIFRANTVTEAFITLRRIFSVSLIAAPAGAQLHCIPPIALFLVVEWLQRSKPFTLQIDFIRNVYIRWGIYYSLLMAIYFFSQSHVTPFIYIQF